MNAYDVRGKGSASDGIAYCAAEGQEDCCRAFVVLNQNDIVILDT